MPTLVDTMYIDNGILFIVLSTILSTILCYINYFSAIMALMHFVIGESMYYAAVKTNNCMHVLGKE